MSTRSKLTGCCAGAALILSGCASGQLARPQGPTALPDATEIEATTVSLTCGKRTDAGIAAVPAAIAAIGIDFAVDLVSKLLKDAQEKRNAAWSATGIAEECIPDLVGQSVTGELWIQRAVVRKGSDWKNPLPSPGFKLRGTVTLVRHKGKDDKADQLLEISFDGVTEFTYGRTAAATRGSGRKHVVVLLGLSANSPLKGKPATGAEDLPGALRLDLGTLRDGRRYDAGMLAHVKGLATIVASPPVNPGAPSPEAPRKLLLTAIVVESENELIALKALTDAYDSNKDDLTAALRAALGIKNEE